MTTQTDLNQLSAIAARLREMREILGWTPEDMAEKTEVTPEEYRLYEAGRTDLPFTFIYKAAQAFNMELTELLEGFSACSPRLLVSTRNKTRFILPYFKRRYTCVMAVTVLPAPVAICTSAFGLFSAKDLVRFSIAVI